MITPWVLCQIIFCRCCSCQYGTVPLTRVNDVFQGVTLNPPGLNCSASLVSAFRAGTTSLCPNGFQDVRSWQAPQSVSCSIPPFSDRIRESGHRSVVGTKAAEASGEFLHQNLPTECWSPFLHRNSRHR